MKILYIAGLAHSGSTYLSRVLNQHSEVFSAGEIIYLHEALTEPVDCACRVSTGSTCSFWPRIARRLELDASSAQRVSYVSKHHGLEWLKALTGWYKREGRDSFPGANGELFRAVSDQSGAGVVLDASKTLWRALPLWRAFPEKLYLLHLMKAPENQLESRLRMGYNFWHSLFMKYVRKNYLYHRLFSDRPTYKRVLFENLVKRPEKTVREVHEWLDLPYENPFQRPFEPFHHLRGNDQVKGNMASLRPKEEKLTTHRSFSPRQWRALHFVRESMYEPALMEHQYT